jgi:hypothetical protein
VAKAYSASTSALADKTGKQVVAYLSQYFASHGWISQDQAQSVEYSDSAE